VPEGKTQEQVILPWKIAIRITLRGLKVRLGRSLITMSGVVLGIAFFMSVLTGEGLKSGLAKENRTKTEVTRLLKLVEEEIGTFKDHKVSVLFSGEISDEHKLRLFRRIAQDADPGSIWFFRSQSAELKAQDAPLQEVFKLPAFKQARDADELFRDSHLVLLMNRQLPQLGNDVLVRYLNSMHQPVLLDYHHGRYDQAELREIGEKVVYSSLTMELDDEEKEKLEKRLALDRARRIWITVVSMLVTLIGIANAMLMSVTERIREIGTMKCLGALSGFVVKLFLIESFLIGVLGSTIGTLLGFVVPFVAYMLSTGVALMLASTPFLQLVGYGVESALVGTVLAIVAAIYPAVVAAKMVPADALRSNV